MYLSSPSKAMVKSHSTDNLIEAERRKGSLFLNASSNIMLSSNGKSLENSGNREDTPRLRETVKKLEEVVKILNNTNTQLTQRIAFLEHRVEELAAEDPYSGHDPSKRPIPDGLYI